MARKANAPKAYESMVALLRDVHDLRRAAAVLDWDQQIYMPVKGNDARSRQSALLAELAHQKFCDPRLGEAVEASLADAALSPARRACVLEVKRDRDKAVKVPADLVREIQETAGRAHMAWVNARKENRFAGFAPFLARLIELRTREADALGVPEGGVPYDALLDQFEPGATVKTLNPVIERARDECVAAVKAIRGSARKPKLEILKRRYPKEGQEKFSRQILTAMHYDTQGGRLDESVHPFTTSFDIDDVRITTRYEERWLPGALFGTIHEAGHALYEQGLDRAHWGTPLADALSVGFHESQSRFWENQIGRSLAFWAHFYPSLKRLFPAALKGVSLKDFHFAVNAVHPSLIRVEADEVTYNLHIVIRYEIEQAIFAGKAKVADLPALWNEKMRAYLGIVPPTDALGVLQDIHWSMGAFGYFPTYLLGNLYAAQWMNVLRKAMPDLEARVGAGDLLPVKTWLNEQIHRHGRRYPTDRLSKRVSGEPLNPAHFAAYLREKFGALYDVTW